jgi:hypothetical protein
VIPLPPLPKGVKPMHNAMEVENNLYQAGFGGRYTQGDAAYWKGISDRIAGGEMLYSDGVWRPYPDGSKDPVVIARQRAAENAGAGYGAAPTTPLDVTINGITYKNVPASKVFPITGGPQGIGRVMTPPGPAAAPTAPGAGAAPAPAPPVPGAPAVNLPAVPTAGVPLPTGGVMGPGGGPAPIAGPAAPPIPPVPGGAPAPPAAPGAPGLAPQEPHLTGTPVMTPEQTAANTALGELQTKIMDNQAKSAGTLQRLDNLENAARIFQNSPLGGFGTSAAARKATADWLVDKMSQVGFTPGSGLYNMVQSGDIINKEKGLLVSDMVRALGSREAASVWNAVGSFMPSTTMSFGGFQAILNSLRQEVLRDRDLYAFQTQWLNDPSHNKTIGATGGGPTMMQAFEQAHPIQTYASRVVPIPVTNHVPAGDTKSFIPGARYVDAGKTRAPILEATATGGFIPTGEVYGGTQ